MERQTLTYLNKEISQDIKKYRKQFENNYAATSSTFILIIRYELSEIYFILLNWCYDIKRDTSFTLGRRHNI